jgi:hypothetical protein
MFSNEEKIFNKDAYDEEDDEISIDDMIISVGENG